MNIHVILLLLVTIAMLNPCKVFADDPAKVEFKEDFVDTVANKISESMLVEQFTDQKYLKTIDEMNVEKETATLLRTLKDPFIAQLPVPRQQTEESKSPKQVETISQQINTETSSEGASEEEEIVIPKPEFKISGIVWNSDRPQAIIEDRVLEIGDTIENWSISNIDQRGVEIIYLDFKYILAP